MSSNLDSFSLLKASLSRLSLLTTLTLSLALLLNESSAGVCVEPESPEALIEAITSLYENPTHVSDMGNNGRKWIVNYYARSVVIDAYDNMVREVSG